MFRFLKRVSSKIPKDKSPSKTIDWKGIPDYDLAVNPHKIAPDTVYRYTAQLKRVLEKNKSDK